MRSDMAKVIVERPRCGGGGKAPKGWRRMWQRFSIDEQPHRESIGRKWQKGCPKYLNENLAPLKRFLRSSVGRLWDKVFSEICEHIRVDSAVQKHVRDHLNDFVALDVVVMGRDVYAKPG